MHGVLNIRTGEEEKEKEIEETCVGTEWDVDVDELCVLNVW